MGARALVRIEDNGKELCAIYVQYGGYPGGLMFNVAKFLADKRLVNGYNSSDEINGAGDLAAQIIALLKLNESNKICAGRVYIVPTETKNVGEEWIYYIKCSNSSITIEVFDENEKMIWKGSPKEYIEFFKVM